MAIPDFNSQTWHFIRGYALGQIEMYHRDAETLLLSGEERRDYMVRVNELRALLQLESGPPQMILGSDPID